MVDFVVGRVLTHNGDATVSGLDDVTTYYLLHRHDFGMDDAPIGACILYAISCGLSDRELTDRYEILARTGGSDSDDEVSDAEDAVRRSLSPSLHPAVRSSSRRGVTGTVRIWDSKRMAALLH